MSQFIFHPELSFHARCFWHEGYADLDAAQCTSDNAQPIWVEVVENGDGDEWVYAQRPVPPATRDKGVVSNIFWFGTYEVGGQYAYEIRPAYRDATAEAWPALEYLLETSWDRWVVMAPTKTLVGGDGRSYWSIPNLDPARLEKDLWFCNLRLISPAGRRVKRYRQYGRYFLGDWHGYGGTLALEILDFPVPPHRAPQPHTSED